MSTLEEAAVGNGAPTPTDNPERGSLMARIRAEREQIIDQEPLDMRIPKYKSLVARYRPIAWEQGQEAFDRGSKDQDNPRAMFNVWVDELIFSCRGLYALNPDGAETVKLDGRKVKATKIAPGYSKELADFLGVQVDTARHAALAAFGDPAPSDEPHDDEGASTRLSHHHTLVLQWMRGTGDDEGVIAERDEEAQGE